MTDSRSRVFRWVVFSLVLAGLAALLLVVAYDFSPRGGNRKVEGYQAWSKEMIDLADTLPVQEGGRVKPFSTYAGFTMLRLHGARSMKVEGDSGPVKIGPTALLLDCFFRPELAVKLPTFRVDNSAVLEAVGLKTGAKRDRYSYEDLESGVDRLNELARSFAEIDQKDRDPMQNELLDLADNVRLFVSLVNHFAFARSPIEMKDGAKPGQATDITAVMSVSPVIREERDKALAAKKPMPQHITDLMRQVASLAEYADTGLIVLPPGDAKETSWHSAGREIMDVVEGGAPDPQASITEIQQMENLVRAEPGGESSFRPLFAAWRDGIVKRAEARGEYRAVPMEARYNRMDWFLKALVCYILGTLAMAVMYFAELGFGARRVARLCRFGVWGFVVAGLVMSVVAIATRCMIMQRPPVGNLYDTIIFIATASVVFLMVFEWFTRRGFALALAPVAGMALILLSRMFEVGDAKDHMDPLVAVLASNFWLTIHVITITLGYAGGLLTALFGAIYILLRGLGLDAGSADLRRMLTRATYGCVCLTLFLSLTGTVLGGIWANYSWGRFWGWDPKENGALLIVLWNLAVLHARMGGIIREWGLHLAAVFGSTIVVFSWWHVNFLNVGLHTYGFTSGKGVIWMIYLVVALFLAFGFVARELERRRARAS